MNLEIEKIGGNSQVSSQRELEGDQGGDTIGAATVVAAQRHRPVDHDGVEEHLAMAKHRATPGRRRGCRHAFQPAMVAETQR
jgi:hypothetical protein